MNKKMSIVIYTLSCLSLLSYFNLPTWAASPTVIESCVCTCPAPVANNESQETVEGGANGGHDSTTDDGFIDTPDETANPVGQDPETPTANQSPEPYLLFINELLPNPDGRDTDNEFIELINRGNEAVDLAGWTLRIGSRDFTFTDGALVPGQLYFWLYSATKLTLTNTGGTVELNSPNGITVDAVTYDGPAPTGQSFARTELDAWQWTGQPTPGMLNQFSIEETDGPTGPSDIVPYDSGPADEVSDDNNNSGIQDSNAATDAGDVSMPDSVVDLEATDLVLNEFLPDPEGSDDQEWIELWNRGQSTIQLVGWTIDDQEGGSPPFSLTGQLLANEIMALNKPETGLALNNGGDSVRLIAPNGTIIDQVTYQTAPTGQSFCRNGDQWFWSDQPSPGGQNPNFMANLSKKEPKSTESESPDATASAFEETIQTTPISQIPELEDNELITTEGVVTLPFGVLGKTIFMVQDEAGSAGAEIRVTSRNLPEISEGDRLRLTGRLTRLTNGWRLSVRTDGIETLGQSTGYTLTPNILSPEQIGEKENGIFGQTTGIIASRTSQKLRLTDQSGIPEIDMLAADGSSLPGEAGQELTAAGIIHWTGNRAELIILDLSRLSVTNLAQNEMSSGDRLTDGVAPKTLALTATQKAGNGRPPTWVIILSLAAAAAIGTWAVFGRRRAATTAND